MRPKRVPEGACAYGRVEYFLVVNADIIQELADHNDTPAPPTNPVVLAVISPIPSFKCHPDCNLISYKLPNNKLANPELVDTANLECLVGRVQARDQTWYVVDRTTVVGRLDMVNSVLDPA